jgi:hypothetical protein
VVRPPTSDLRPPISELRPPISDSELRPSRQHIFDRLFALDGLPRGFFWVLRLGERRRIGMSRPAQCAGSAPSFLWTRDGTAGEEQQQHHNHGQGRNEAERLRDREHRDAILNDGAMRHAADDKQLGMLNSVDAAVVEEHPAALAGGGRFGLLGFHVEVFWGERIAAKMRKTRKSSPVAAPPLRTVPPLRCGLWARPCNPHSPASIPLPRPFCAFCAFSRLSCCVLSRRFTRTSALGLLLSAFSSRVPARS